MNQAGPPNNGEKVDLSPADEIRLLDEEFDVYVEPPLLPKTQPLRKMFKVLAVIEQMVGALLMIALLGLTVALVIQRYRRGGWPGTGELARYMLVWGTFVTAGYLVAYPPRHITIAVVDYFVKGRWLGAFKLFSDLVILASSLVVLYGGYQLLATDIGQTTPAAGIPLFWVNMVPFAGFALVAIRAVLGIVTRDVPVIMGKEVES